MNFLKKLFSGDNASTYDTADWINCQYESMEQLNAEIEKHSDYKIVNMMSTANAGGNKGCVTVQDNGGQEHVLYWVDKASPKS